MIVATFLGKISDFRAVPCPPSRLGNSCAVETLAVRLPVQLSLQLMLLCWSLDPLIELLHILQWIATILDENSLCIIIILSTFSFAPTEFSVQMGFAINLVQSKCPTLLLQIFIYHLSVLTNSYVCLTFLQLGYFRLEIQVLCWLVCFYWVQILQCSSVVKQDEPAGADGQLICSVIQLCFQKMYC